MECSLPNNGKTLQRPWITVIQEEWDSSTEVINDKCKKKCVVKECDNLVK